MTIIGVILLLLGIIAFLAKPYLSEEDVMVDNRLVKKKSSPFLLMLNRKTAAALATAGLALVMLPSMFFWAEPGYQYFMVYPTGNVDAVMSQGIKWRGFASITAWQKYIDVKVVDDGDPVDDIEGIMKPIPIRFIDQVTANVKLSSRFQMPSDEESFKNLAMKFRSMDNLVQNTLIPTVREQTYNTGYMFSAQNYISGEAQSFRQTLDEQLKNGAYAVEKIEHKDTLFTDIQEEERSIKEVRTRYTVVMVEENGLPKRIPHEITENKIIVSQVIVDDVELEPIFKTRLEAQRDESAKRQIEQQKVETAKAAQTRIIAEGERDKAAERVAQEKEQVKQLISIETKLKQERTNKELAAIALETERLKSQQRKVAADAQAYENAKLVTAGLTPQEKAEWDYRKAVGVAAELSKIKYPETMIISGEDKKSGGSPLETLIGAAMAKQLLNEKKDK
ncbi:cell envelope integrity protein TolA [Limibacter armeniacum]|uniref:cell envelope integrity protein TolA n=1 Tax=Limibacter armeniacum TaxID=466084 RepID=UPI002FE52A8E